MRTLKVCIGTTVGLIHFVTYLMLVAHAVAVDSFSESLPKWQSVLVSMLAMPLMPLSRWVAGSFPAVVALAIANSSLWAVGSVFAVGMWRRRQPKRKNA
jgi:hypothetical protein